MKLMNRTTATRLARIEKAIAPPRRKFILCDGGGLDLEAEEHRLREEEG